jgi:glucose/mannose transport system substrate-binding protein
MASIVGPEIFLQVYKDKNAEVAAGTDIAKVFKAADDARKLAAKSNVQNWSEATNLVITDQAGGQIMGDWAQGEFQVAGKVAGKDYTCLPGLGLTPVIATGGDAFYFPKVDDPEISAAQETLAHVLLSPETQVAFNLKKGSLPVRGDVDLTAANDCMKKGLEILAAGKTMQWTDELISPDTNQELNDLMVEFFSTPSMTAEEAQKRFAEIIAKAD